MKAKGLVFETALSRRTEPADLVLADTSRFGSDGDFAGAGQPNWVQEPSGLWVLDFNSANPDYVEIPAAATQLNFTSEDFSVVISIYPDTITPFQHFFVRGLTDTDGWRFDLRDNGRPGVVTYQSAASQITRSDAGYVLISNWYTVGFSRDGATVKIYVNGVETAYGASGTHIDPLTSARTAKIGIYDDKSQNPFDGKIAYLAIWNYALSAGQHLKKHYELTRLTG